MSTTPRPLAETKALRAFHAIVAKLDEHLAYDGALVAATKDATPTRQGTGDQQWYRGPVLCRDYEGWSTTTAWAVVWEDGEFEWVHEDFLHPIDSEQGVFTEPIQSFSLGLYPA